MAEEYKYRFEKGTLRELEEIFVSRIRELEVRLEKLEGVDNTEMVEENIEVEESGTD